MTDPLDDEVQRWRDAQPAPPAIDLARVTAVQGRMRRWVPLTAAAAAVAVAAGGLGLLQRGGGDDPTPVFSLVGNVQPAAAGSTTAADVAAGQTAFGLELLALRCKADPTANDVLSPASAALALGMLSTGARGQTRTDIEDLLHLPSGGTGLVAAQREQSTGLAALEQLDVSNHVYTQRGIRPAQDVLDELATSYDSDLRTLDFAMAPGPATDAINADVSKDTKSLIPKLFDAPLGVDTTTVLTNALYLKAAWAKEFKAALPRRFRTAAGKTVSVAMMQGEELPGQVRSAGQWASVTLPYAGGELEAVVILPARNVQAAVCAMPSRIELKALTEGRAVGGGGINLPRLDLTQTGDLTTDLAGLGLPLQGDYSGLGAANIEVSKVVQKTVLKIDEKGTVAAAATGVVGTTSSASAGPLQADQPFSLLIRDTKTGTPLFQAHINDPTVTTR